MALTVCLARLRSELRRQPLIEIKFTIHSDNGAMRKLAEKLGLQPTTLSFRVPISLKRLIP